MENKNKIIYIIYSNSSEYIKDLSINFENNIKWCPENNDCLWNMFDFECVFFSLIFWRKKSIEKCSSLISTPIS